MVSDISVGMWSICVLALIATEHWLSRKGLWKWCTKTWKTRTSKPVAKKVRGRR